MSKEILLILQVVYIGLLEVADLSLDALELQAVSFGLGDVEAKSVEENETIEEEEEEAAA